jgi:competence protein ComEA
MRVRLPQRRRPWVAAGICCLLSLVLGLLASPVARANPGSTELNLANQAELEQLKSIGPQLSARILAERTQHGPFVDWADFMRRMKGVGPATARRLSAGGLVVQGHPLAVLPAAVASVAPPASAASSPILAP